MRTVRSAVYHLGAGHPAAGAGWALHRRVRGLSAGTGRWGARIHAYVGARLLRLSRGEGLGSGYWDAAFARAVRLFRLRQRATPGTGWLAPFVPLCAPGALARRRTVDAPGPSLADGQRGQRAPTRCNNVRREQLSRISGQCDNAATVADHVWGPNT